MKYNIKKYNCFDIDLKGKTSGQIKTTCPKCSTNRKNKKDKCLSVNIDEGVANCHHCNEAFSIHEYEYNKVEYKKPEWKNKTDISTNLVQWFEGRGIGQDTLRQLKISEGREWMPQPDKKINTIQFNYFRDGELLNVKYRGGDKSFKMFTGGEMILYNLDSIKDLKECIIVEGEIDCMSYIEATVNNVVSVPNGATLKENNLSYINNCYKYFEDKEKIYIAVDNDEAGHSLKQDLIKRLGDERCYEVDFKECKDANDYLQKYGKTELFTTIENAKLVQLDGIFRISDIEKDLDNLLEVGLESGKKVKHDNLDELITWETGRVCTVTGIPGHGKSEALDEIIERLNVFHGWKAGYFSPENFPLQLHASKIVSKLTGKKFDKNTLYGDEYSNVKQYMEDNFWFIKPKDEDFTLDNILDRARVLVFKYGIKILAIDPYNRLEDQQPSGMSETKYIGLIYTKLTNFAQRNNVLVFLVAHPIKIKKENGIFEIPNLYNISGSANFFNKTDYGFTVYQDFNKQIVQIHVQKVKFKHLGHVGLAEFRYNMNNGRFVPFNPDNALDITWDNSNHIVSGIKEVEIKPNLEFNEETPF